VRKRSCGKKTIGKEHVQWLTHDAFCTMETTPLWSTPEK
jgi:hypothetical protein